MGSSRDRDDLLSFTNNPSSSSSPITVSDHLDSFLGGDQNHNSGSFQGESLLGGGESVSSSSYAEFGFNRPDFRLSQLAGTVQFYERHVFLCYKNPSVWPARIEAAEFDRLPRLLSAAVSARKSDMKKETRLTICEGHDGTETSNGDVIIFPDMIRYRRLTHFDVDTFVEEVLVKDGEWLPGTPEVLKGFYIFVCCHGSRDRRCGICGPALVSRFREDIKLYGLQGKVSVSPCSHVGGHKYAGNVIIFGSNNNGEVTGHWYGYVTPDDVSILLEDHIRKGEIVDWLWRGQMGVSEEGQEKSQELRLHLNGVTKIERSNGQAKQGHIDGDRSEATITTGCCRDNGSSLCCQNMFPEHADNLMASNTNLTPEKKKRTTKKAILWTNSGKGISTRKVCAMPTWLESWEREDTYAALAVVCAAVSVGIAYSCYKQLK